MMVVEWGSSSRPWWMSEVVDEELMISQLKPRALTMFHSLGVLMYWWSNEQGWLPRFPRDAWWQSAHWPAMTKSWLWPPASHSLAGKGSGSGRGSGSTEPTWKGAKKVHLHYPWVLLNVKSRSEHLPCAGNSNRHLGIMRNAYCILERFFFFLIFFMWDLPGPGLEPVSPALAGGFLTTAPPGKPSREILYIHIYRERNGCFTQE